MNRLNLGDIKQEKVKNLDLYKLTNEFCFDRQHYFVYGRDYKLKLINMRNGEEKVFHDYNLRK